MTRVTSKTDQHEKLLEAWVSRYEAIEKHGDRSPTADADFWAYEKLDTLCRQDPEVAWTLILQVLGRTQNEFVLENLAAGPLETLLASHGARMIDRVEARAAANSRFKWLLAGVWRNAIPDAIWRRIERSTVGTLKKDGDG